MKIKIVIGLLLLVVLGYLFSVISYKSKPKIALISVNGVISDSTEIIREFRMAERDNSIKAMAILIFIETW